VPSRKAREPRDSQRKKVYRAECVLNGFPKAAARLETIDEIQKWVDKIVNSKSFRKRFGDRPWDRPEVIVSAGGHGRRRPVAYGTILNFHPCMKFPKWSRMKWIILHELAHICTFAKVKVNGEWELTSSHGWKFCENFLWLVGRFIGVIEREALRISFKKNKVKFKPPRKRAPLTKEQRERQREILVKARAARAKRMAAKEKP
jgi:hypothetical protein